jgi:divinyl chlorophyllide a 8-vinyl-reductase
MALRVLLLGATGTIGQATARALVQRGHEVVALVRAPALRGPGAVPAARAPGVSSSAAPIDRLAALQAIGVTLREGDVRDPQAVAVQGLRGERFDAIVSCLASRSGAPRDAWAIDHDAHQHALAAAVAGGIGQFVLLSALCVQKPRLAFQHAKLAFEQSLMASPLAWSIVRPTAYFKSLSGQIARVRAGKPFLVFGDGRLTACKPIADEDLGEYLASCLHEPTRQRCILPIGGPGPAITPLDQAQMLSDLLGRQVPVRHVPLALMDAIVGGLSLAARVSRRLADRAEFARTGRYYATESMLVWDAQAGRYDASATPETGSRTLKDFYADVLQGRASVDLGEHAVF